MKKRILFLIVILCCTGCHVDYHLNIDNVNVIKNNVNFSINSSADVVEFEKFQYYIPIDYRMNDGAVFEKRIKDISYYNLNKSDKKLNFFYRKFDVTQLKNEFFSHYCYQYVTVMNQDKDKELLISTSREFLCFDKYDNLDDVTVTITSKYKLKDTNADEVSRHTYRWFINKENAKDKYLYLVLNTDEKDLNLLERIIEGDFTNTFTIFLTVFVIISIIIFLFKKKGDRKNRV